MAFLNTNLWNQLFSKKHENNKNIDSSDLGYVDTIKVNTNKPKRIDDDVAQVNNNLNSNIIEDSEVLSVNKSSNNINLASKNDYLMIPNNNDTEVLELRLEVSPNSSKLEVSELLDATAPNTKNNNVELDVDGVKVNQVDNSVDESLDLASTNKNNSVVNEITSNVSTNDNNQVINDKTDYLKSNDNNKKVSENVDGLKSNLNDSVFKKISSVMLLSLEVNYKLAPDSGYKIVGGSSIDDSYTKNAKETWLNGLENTALLNLSKLIPNQLLGGNLNSGYATSTNNLLTGAINFPLIANWDLATAYLSIKGLKSDKVDLVKPGTNYIELGSNLLLESAISGFGLNKLLGTSLSNKHAKIAGVDLIDKNQSNFKLKVRPDGLIYRGDDINSGATYRNNNGLSSTIIDSSNTTINYFKLLSKEKRSLSLYDNSRWAITFTRLGYHTPSVPYSEYFGSTGFLPVIDFSLSTIDLDVDAISYADEFTMNIPSKLRYNMSLTMNIVNDLDNTIVDYLRSYRRMMYGNYEFLRDTNINTSPLLGIKSYRKCTLLINIFIYDRLLRLLTSKYENDFSANGWESTSYYSGIGSDYPNKWTRESRYRYFVNYFGLVAIPRLNLDNIDGINKAGTGQSIVNLTFDIVGFWNKPTPNTNDLVTQRLNSLLLVQQLTVKSSKVTNTTIDNEKLMIKLLKLESSLEEIIKGRASYGRDEGDE